MSAQHKSALAGAAAAALLLPAGCLIAVPALFASPPPAQAACGGAGPAIGVATGPLPATVAGYPAQPSLAGAAAIMRAAKDAGLDQRAQTIGVMTAMGESSLRPISHGDSAGPNSRGWFQQRDWGSLADELDPYRSATMFYTGGQHGEPGLADIPGWETMTPTEAAHAVQRNADPNYYTQFWDPAVTVVAALAGVPVTVTPGAGNQTCGTAPGGAIPAGAGGWVKPTVGTLTSGFSSRINPVTGAPEHHNGQDIAAACGTPIYAAHDGDVIKAGPSSGFGDAIFLDNGVDAVTGAAIVTWYGHEFPDGIEVHVGDRVKAGQEIGKVGSNGQSTGCHDHFEVHVNGVAVDPVPFMAMHGAPLG